MMKNGTVRIMRNNEWGARDCKLRVLIDGTKVGEIASNSSKDFTVAVGEHNVQVGDLVFASKPMSVPVAEGQLVKFKVIVPGHETMMASVISCAMLNIGRPQLERVRT